MSRYWLFALIATLWLSNILTTTITVFDNVDWYYPKQDSLSQAVVKLVLEFYMNISTTLSLTHAASSPEENIRQSRMINEILYKINSEMVVCIEEHDSLAEWQPRYFNLIFVDSYEAFR